MVYSTRFDWNAISSAAGFPVPCYAVNHKLLFTLVPYAVSDALFAPCGGDFFDNLGGSYYNEPIF
jgi:hypothetical protein